MHPMLDATELAHGLYQGSAPIYPDLVGASGFKVLVLCAEEFQPDEATFEGVRVIRAPFDDAKLKKEEMKRASAAAMTIAGELARGRKVLVTCFAGRNRSGLVCALSLHILTGQPGRMFRELIQKKRAYALTNETFVAAIDALKERS